MKDWIASNLLLKSIALLLTMILYLFVRGDTEQVKSVFVDITTEIPQDQIFLKEPLNRVRFTVRGKRSAMDRLEQQTLKPLTVNAEDAKNGSFDFTPDMVQFPPGLTVTSIQPPSMKFNLDERIRRSTQVLLRISGKPQKGHEITRRTVTPQKVEVIGPASVLKDLSAFTEVLNIADRTQSLQSEIMLRAPAGVEFKPEKVSINIEIKPQVIERSYKDLAISVRNTRHAHTVYPNTLSATLRGPRATLEALEASTLAPVVDAHEEDTKPLGTYRKKVEIDNLPPDVKVVRVQPPYINLTTVPNQRDKPLQGPEKTQP